MAAHFRMSDLDALSYYLGIKVRQGKEELTLGQSAYACKLLERSDMTECKPCVTPMEERLKLTKASTAAKVDATLYRSIVGGLRYLVHTRLDITFVVGYVSRFMEDPREDHWAVVKRPLRYVKGTVDHRIIFPKTGGGKLQLIVFSDADMVGDIDGRQSTSGVLVFFGSALISWLSLKQKVVALSTCEAEYVAAATAACQVVWLRRLLGELTGVEAHPTRTDGGQPARHRPLRRIRFCTDRSKHIDVKFHFLRDCVDGGQIPGNWKSLCPSLKKGSLGNTKLQRAFSKYLNKEGRNVSTQDLDNPDHIQPTQQESSQQQSQQSNEGLCNVSSPSQDNDTIRNAELREETAKR
ncbi:uncharacterized mitochondrial protein AtMg00810-like [Miscanthus floridulus]|uniref:uncharacterized mitochondrial protein AtMg00810-like n=1 Tax=Miscanthus floridulus TaxID=154761 RepID=UPI0034593263